MRCQTRCTCKYTHPSWHGTQSTHQSDVVNSPQKAKETIFFFCCLLVFTLAVYFLDLHSLKKKVWYPVFFFLCKSFILCWLLFWRRAFYSFLLNEDDSSTTTYYYYYVLVGGSSSKCDGMAHNPKAGLRMK